MDLENEQMGEMMAHLYSAYQLGLVLSARVEQRNRKRLEKARQRLDAPTTHESGPLREQRTA